MAIFDRDKSIFFQRDKPEKHTFIMCILRQKMTNNICQITRPEIAFMENNCRTTNFYKVSTQNDCRFSYDVSIFFICSADWNRFWCSVQRYCFKMSTLNSMRIAARFHSNFAYFLVSLALKYLLKVWTTPLNEFGDRFSFVFFSNTIIFGSSMSHNASNCSKSDNRSFPLLLPSDIEHIVVCIVFYSETS